MPQNSGPSPPYVLSPNQEEETKIIIIKIIPQALFDRQVEYFDVSVVNETRNTTYTRLATLAAASVGVDKARVYGLLEIPAEPVAGAYNTGNSITDDVKMLVKAARLTGVHVSPTVLFNGNVEGKIQSAWDVAKWEAWLEENIK